MEKYITISYDNKKYKMVLSEELDEALKKALGKYYAFNEKRFLIRQSSELLNTIKINKIINDVFLDVLSNYELDGDLKQFIELSKIEMLEENFITAQAYIRSVDTLVLIYNDIVKSKKNDNKNEQEETRNEKKEITSPVLHDENLSKEIIMPSNDVNKNISLAYRVLIRASLSEKFKDFFTEEKINEAIKKIVICKDEKNFKEIMLKNSSSEDERKRIESGAFILSAFNTPEDGKIYIKKDTKLEVIVHELVHFLSLNNNIPGLKKIGEELIPNDILERLRISTNDLNSLKLEYSEALNEATTNYITSQILPEIKVEDAYTYGALFLEKYIKVCKNKNIENKLFNAYFHGDKKSLEYIINYINGIKPDFFYKILDSMYLSQNFHMGLLPIKYTKNIVTNKVVDETLDLIKDSEEQNRSI